MKTLVEAWTGVMIDYTEQDFPTSEPYLWRVPGWQCNACGARIGTAGLPPARCECGQEWGDATATRVAVKEDSMNKVYVASAFKDYQRCRDAQAALKAVGFECTHDWTKEVDDNPQGGTLDIDTRYKYASDDIEGVRSADYVLVLVPDKRGVGCGLWIEAGAGLALGKVVVFAGPLANGRTIFDALTEHVAVTDEEAIKWMAEHLAERQGDLLLAY